MIETPIDALTWLGRQAKKIKLGRNDYQQIRKIILDLLEQRNIAHKQISALEVEIARLQKPKLKDPYGTDAPEFRA